MSEMCSARAPIDPNEVQKNRNSCKVSLAEALAWPVSKLFHIDQVPYLSSVAQAHKTRHTECGQEIR